MSSLPRKEDINVYDSLDERSAVKNFYGKTLEEIYKRLFDEYESLQEDLAFMGPVGFAYYAQAWERFCRACVERPDDDENKMWTLESVLEWTQCIISIRCISLDTETPESIAAMHRMLAFFEEFYNSEACRQYYAEHARRYGYAESLIDLPPELQEKREECARLRAKLEQQTARRA